MPCMQGGTMSSAPGANTMQHSGTSDDGCAWQRRGGGALARHRCVYDTVMLSSMRTTTSQPVRLSRHLMRNGAKVLAAGAWWHGARPVWGTPYNSGDDFSLPSVEILRRSGAQGNEGGYKKERALPIAPIVHRA